MYLAGILGLCALLHAPALGHVSSAPSSLAPISKADILGQASNQETAKPDQPMAQSPQLDQPKPDTSQPAPQEAQPSENAQQPQSSNPPAPSAVPSGRESPNNPKTAATPKKQPARKKRTSPSAGQEPQRKVVRRGGTAEPTTQLAPGMTDEQAARQRQSTNQLLTSTDASLQKLAGRQLTKDEQETVVQIRKFMEQVKAADAAGDLQRAYKLALKAHLLSDALAKP
jgi:outer membrane biosynthesis protein TonB